MILPLLLSLVAPAAAEAPPSYSGRESQVRVEIPRIEEQVKVDGILNEAAWERSFAFDPELYAGCALAAPAGGGTPILSYLFRM